MIGLAGPLPKYGGARRTSPKKIMPTPGVKLLMKRHLDALNRLRRLGRGSVKLSSELNQIKSVLASSGLDPEKQAEIYKKILMKATPVRPGVIPKESEVTGVPPDSSHAPGLIREAGRINPGQDDTSQKISSARDVLKSAMLMPRNSAGRKISLKDAKHLVMGNAFVPASGNVRGTTARQNLNLEKSKGYGDKGYGDKQHHLVESTRSSLEINDRIEAGARAT